MVQRALVLLTFHLALPSDQSVDLICDISQHLHDWHRFNTFDTDIHGSKMMNPNDFCDPLTFPLAIFANARRVHAKLGLTPCFHWLH